MKSMILYHCLGKCCVNVYNVIYIFFHDVGGQEWITARLIATWLYPR